MPGELVDFYRSGPAAPFALDESPAPLTTPDTDTFWFERVADLAAPGRDWPVSPRWIPIANHDHWCVLVATRPTPAPLGAVIVWDTAPESPQPLFPTLHSFLWFLIQVAEQLLSGGIEDERDFENGWTWDLLHPTRSLVPAYHDLHAQACALAPRHDGWVDNQPLPRDGGWTSEWLQALGVADLDLA